MGKYEPVDWTERDGCVEAVSLHVDWVIQRVLR